MSWRAYLFSFHGRLNRARYWLYMVLAVLAFAALYVAGFAYAMSFPGAYENGGPTPWPTEPLGIAGAIAWCLALFALCWSTLAVAIKRLHDRDKGWWWVLLFVVAPAMGPFLDQYLIHVRPGSAQPLMVLPLGAVVLSVWGFIELACLRGTASNNRYGPDPLAK